MDGWMDAWSQNFFGEGLGNINTWMDAWMD